MLTNNDINPFDLLSGKVAKTNKGIFYFKNAGLNTDEYGLPIWKNLHREDDLPAVEYFDGAREWWVNGVEHRENDMPAVIWATGTKFWYKDGRRHRENDLPAVISSNVKVWWEYGRLHRNGGLPAIVQSDGIQRFYYNNVEYYP